VPQRPQGVERNIVVTLRDWFYDKKYLHDLISTDKRYPTSNGYGPLFGSPEYSSDEMPILDPVKNTWTSVKMPVKDPTMPYSLGPATRRRSIRCSLGVLGKRTHLGHASQQPQLDARPAGTRLARGDGADARQSGLLQGRLGAPVGESVPDGSRGQTPRNVRPEDAEVHDRSRPCYGTHHPQFGFDANDTLWTSGGGPVVGWLNTKTFELPAMRRSRRAGRP
jgi:hypothetical protein